MAPRTSQRATAGRQLREACILIYGYGRYVSTPDVIHYILEHGLPSRAEREAYYAARMAEVEPEEAGDNQEELEVPAGVHKGEDQAPDYQT